MITGFPFASSCGLPFAPSFTPGTNAGVFELRNDIPKPVDMVMGGLQTTVTSAAVSATADGFKRSRVVHETAIVFDFPNHASHPALYRGMNPDSGVEPTLSKCVSH